MERPTLRRGEDPYGEEWRLRWQAWIDSWTLDDAMMFLDDKTDEGPQETKAAEVVRAGVESLRGSVDRVRKLHADDRGYCSHCTDGDRVESYPCPTVLELDYP